MSNKVIKCFSENCSNEFIKNSGPHIYCALCAKERKKIGSRNWQRLKPRILGYEVRCCVEGCSNVFIKKTHLHKYCSGCASQNDKEHKKAQSARRRKQDPINMRKYMREWARKRRAEIKNEVLSHYNKFNILQCSVDGCEITDVDMLSLDHLDNGGNQERKLGLAGGTAIYKRLRRAGFPYGYQTLCFNHQYKKEILRRREEYL